ncbi:NAD(P)-binding protein [Polyplosphaeria fusca]|uniref:NAD(P)-binding protein n=1 Tax=Polyplosphaeria fusca TaxID=682080 RepID=A0A9P4QRE0_9PLEO|nr:NAD(P)-binding protein [Polyplosphaeria fusca]
MGLAVATSLSTDPTWTIHILDLSPTSGSAAATSINATFHQTNVSSYPSLSSVFASIYASTRRIDFVFANAGIAEHANFFAPSSTSTPDAPPAGLDAIIDVNLKGVVLTSWLALHYMRLSPPSPSKSLLMTSSCGGLYPSYYSPIYTASKHGVVGFMRSISPYFFKEAGIRVNAICPGTVRTNLLSGEEWGNFPSEYFTPVEKVVGVVGMLVRGRDEGKEGRVLNGCAVEISGERHYYREVPEFCDEAMRCVIGVRFQEAES